MAKESTRGTARSARRPRAVRVWAEVGVTLAVTQDPPQFIKMTFGHERIAPDDKEGTIERYTKMVIDECEAVVESEVKRLKRLIARSS